MFKTIATFAALATLTAASIAPAHAIRMLNGDGVNGLTNNGANENGLHWNGANENTIRWNGVHSNGGSGNGREVGGSTLVIEAIELPPETR